jgi:hypothetical protein
LQQIIEELSQVFLHVMKDTKCQAFTYEKTVHCSKSPGRFKEEKNQANHFLG